MNADEQRGWNKALEAIYAAAKSREASWAKIEDGALKHMGGWRKIEAAHLAGIAKEMMKPEVRDVMVNADLRRAVEAVLQPLVADLKKRGETNGATAKTETHPHARGKSEGWSGAYTAAAHAVDRAMHLIAAILRDR